MSSTLAAKWIPCSILRIEMVRDGQENIDQVIGIDHAGLLSAVDPLLHLGGHNPDGIRDGSLGFVAHGTSPMGKDRARQTAPGTTTRERSGAENIKRVKRPPGRVATTSPRIAQEARLRDDGTTFATNKKRPRRCEARGPAGRERGELSVNQIATKPDPNCARDLFSDYGVQLVGIAECALPFAGTYHLNNCQQVIHVF